MRRPLSLILPFFSVIAIVATLSTFYCARQLCAGLAPDSAWRPVIWTVIALSWSLPPLRILLSLLGRELPFAMFGFYLYGLAASLLVYLLLFQFGRSALSWSSIEVPAQANLGVAALSVGLSFVGIHMALNGPWLKEVEIPILNLVPDLEGLRIVQISDVHVSSILGAEYVSRLCDQVMALKPDLIAITGDLIDGPVSELKEGIKPMAKLQAPLGVYFVTGNHEYIWDAKSWLEEIRPLGFEILENAHRVVERGKAKVLVLGVNDLSAERFEKGQGPNIEAARAEAPRADFTLLLAHQPQAYKLVGSGPCDLLLAGHTHGGQFFPVWPIVKLFHRYFNGLYRHEDKFWVYVNPGSGYWGPPNRFGVPTEITLLTLKRV